MEKVIEVRDLSKQYKTVTAVNKVSFDVYKGEIFSLVGPNGAGKTTTVEILECLRTPTAGSATVLGFDVVKEDKEIKKRIGVMPQDFNAFERLTVKENVELIARIYREPVDMSPILEELGVWEVRNRRFEALSGGMKRRVGISMALISNPELLFLDEPTTGLDPQARRETWEVINRLKKMGKTVVLTSHYMEEVQHLSDRAAIIIGGSVIAIGTVQSLVTDYGGGIRVRIMNGDKKVEDTLANVTNQISREDGITATFQTRQQAGRALSLLYQLGDHYQIDIVEPDMDEVFARLAGGRVNERGEFI